VPAIVRWPGVTKPGSTNNTPVITMDWFVTLLDAAGLKQPPATSPTGASGGDGVSLMPLLRGTGPLPARDLFWHYPHHQHYQLGGAMPYGAIRSGDFKLVEHFNDMSVELYNLRDDIGETRDLAAVLPDKAKELRARLQAWRQEVGAQMPTPNPIHDPTKPEYTPPSPGTGKKKKAK
jgi:arylsulfatase A